jgi:tetratricopeptide (TPR) repeat protein
MSAKAFSLDTLAPPLWEFYAAISHFLLRQYDEALARFSRVNERTPKFVHAYTYSACAYVELDRIDDAQTAMKTVLEIMPQYTVKEADRIYAYRLDEDRQRILDDLRKAGLPEG